MGGVADVASLLMKVGIDASGAEKGARQVEGTVDRMTGKTGKAGKDFKKAGAAMGAALGYGLTSAIEQGAKFEDQLRTINTVAKMSEADLAATGDKLQQAAIDFGSTTEDMTGAFYDLVSAGVPADKAMQVLASSATLAKGGLATAGEGVDLMTSSLGAWNLDATESERVMQAWGQAVAAGKTTVADLAGGISQVASIAASAGIEMEEIAAGTAQLTLTGDSASQAMTKQKAAISALLTPNRKLIDLQAKTGKQYLQIAKDKGLHVAMQEMLADTGNNSEAMAFMLGSTEALSYGLQVTGDNAEKYQKQLDGVLGAVEDNTQAQEMMGEKMKSPVEQGKKMAAEISRLAQDFGGLFGAVAPVVMTVNQLGPAFGAATSGAKLLAGALGGLIGGFGGVGKRFMGKFAHALTAAGGVAQKAILGVLAKVGLAEAASSLASKFMGAFAAALPLVAVAAGGVAIGAVIGKMIVGPAVDAATAEMQKKAGDALAAAHGNDAELARQQAVLEQGLRDFHGQLGADRLVAEQGDKLQQQLDAVLLARQQLADGVVEAATTTTDGMSVEQKIEQELQAAARSSEKGMDAIAGAYGTTAGEIQGMLDSGMALFTDDMIAEMRSGSKKWQDAIIADMGLSPETEAALRAKLQGAGARLGKVARGVTGKMKETIKGQADGFSQAWDAVSNAMGKGPKIMSLSKRLAQGRKALKHSMAMMRKAIKQGDPLAASYWADQYGNVQTAMGNMRKTTTDTMDNVQSVLAIGRRRFKKTDKGITADARGEARKRKKTAQAESDKAADALPTALQESKGATATAAGNVSDAAGDPLRALAASSYTWGNHAGGRYADGVLSQVGRAAAAGQAIASAVAGPIKFSAPPKKGALRTIDEWGDHMVVRWVKPIHKGRKKAEGAGRSLADGLAKGMRGKGGSQAKGGGNAGDRGRDRSGRDVRAAARRGGGDRVVINVGTLIANDAGIDQLQRRMDRRLRLRKRRTTTGTTARG